MKSRNLLGLCSLLALFSACGNGVPKYDATGTFETTEVLVSAEASGHLEKRSAHSCQFSRFGILCQYSAGYRRGDVALLQLVFHLCYLNTDG